MSSVFDWTSTLNAIGLVFNAVGLALLFCFAIAPTLARDTPNAAIPVNQFEPGSSHAQDGRQRSEDLIRRKVLLSYFGFGLLILGFALQFLSSAARQIWIVCPTP